MGPYTAPQVAAGVNSKIFKGEDLVSISADGPWYPLMEVYTKIVGETNANHYPISQQQRKTQSNPSPLDSLPSMSASASYQASYPSKLHSQYGRADPRQAKTKRELAEQRKALIQVLKIGGISSGILVLVLLLYFVFSSLLTTIEHVALPFSEKIASLSDGDPQSKAYSLLGGPVDIVQLPNETYWGYPNRGGKFWTVFFKEDKYYQAWSDERSVYQKMLSQFKSAKEQNTPNYSMIMNAPKLRQRFRKQAETERSTKESTSAFFHKGGL